MMGEAAWCSGYSGKRFGKRLEKFPPPDLLHASCVTVQTITPHPACFLICKMKRENKERTGPTGDVQLMLVSFPANP